MARDLHDSVNQSIHSLVLFAETLEVVLGREEIERARLLIGRLVESARQALKETRLLLYEMQPPRATGADLVLSLDARLAMVERYAGVQAVLSLEDSLDDLPAECADNLFMIALEALNNALKHAQARSVQIVLRRAPDVIELEVADDGCGFDPARACAGRLGLLNQRKRAALLGGRLDIVSSPGHGSRVCFRAEVAQEGAQFT